MARYMTASFRTDGTLLMAKHDDQLLAAIMVFALGDHGMVFLWSFVARQEQSKRQLWACNGGRFNGRRRVAAKPTICGACPDQDEESLEAQFKERFGWALGRLWIQAGLGRRGSPKRR